MMVGKGIKNKLLTRIIAFFLPAAVLPFLFFGYLSVKAHYKFQQEERVRQHEVIPSLLEAHLDSDLQLLKNQLKQLASNKDLRKISTPIITQILSEWRLFNPDVLRILVVNPDETVVAVAALQPEVQNRRFVNSLSLTQPHSDEVAVSPIFADEEGKPYIYLGKRLPTEEKAHLVVEVTLERWLTFARKLLKTQPHILAALIPTGRGMPVSLRDESDLIFWQNMAEIKANNMENGEQNIMGSSHYLSTYDISGVSARLILADPSNIVYQSPRQLLAAFFAIFVAILLFEAGTAMLVTGRIIKPILRTAQMALAFGQGRVDERVTVEGSDELRILAENFNNMADALRDSQLRSRVVYKAVMDLFSCTDADSLLRKAVELACTQCRGEVAWFVPKMRDEAFDDTNAVDLKLHAWLWKNHHVIAMSTETIKSVYDRTSGDRIFSFAVKSRHQEFGILNVAYRRDPEEAIASLLHTLFSLIETALIRHDAARFSALVATELQMAKLMPRNLDSDSIFSSKYAQIAYHYQPANRLGSDWFFLIEDKQHNSLYVIMGDIMGHGLFQGLVSTAVKGALDVLEEIIKNSGKESLVKSPADIIHYLELVIRRASEPLGLNMTCLVAKLDFSSNKLFICNAGHTFPILIRRSDKLDLTQHLHLNQQPILGHDQSFSAGKGYTDSVYDLEPNDFLIVYSDGMSEAKDLSSGVFGRFLFSSLRKKSQFLEAKDLKDEIFEMFQYYTQGIAVDDDVCFLVVKVDSESSSADLGFQKTA